MPTHSGGSKINVINDLMRPFLSVNYISRLVERFAADLLLWNKFKTRFVLRKIPDSKGMTVYQKVLRLLALNENDAVLQELYGSLRDFHLLRFRAFQLSEMLRDLEKIRAHIEQHRKKIAWQVRRIYRTRNLIVHSGKKPKYILSLIENGHDYLDQTLFEVIKMSTGSYCVETFDQAFELARLKYSIYWKNLNSIESFSSDNIDFLLRESWGLERLSNSRSADKATDETQC